MREHNWIQVVFVMMYTHTHRKQSIDCLKRGNIALCFTSTLLEFFKCRRCGMRTATAPSMTLFRKKLFVEGFRAYLHSLPMWLDPNRGC